MTLLSLTLLIFPLLMLVAAFSDLFTMRITNTLVVTVVAGFFIMALVAGFSAEALLSHVAWAAGVLVMAFAFFAFGWIGGGDAKLVAATTLWVGPALLLPYLIYAALLGGALTMALLAIRRWPLPARLQRISWLDRLHDKQQGVPYGIALAAAGLLVYPGTAIFLHFLA
ncbi:MAG TPA: prepilin peptidase [Devosia sp.]